ncbi:CbiX/SirB N-terminal domain-containing protein [Puniceicoccaceae bacterium K14]|nr:CbiX/SirB N-terminal domain-containing protein [Puniceicoccaceae bacterium K14]
MIDSDQQSLNASHCVVLLDNGSLRAETTLRLRALAVELSTRLGVEIFPVSARHSNKVSPTELNGVAAEVWEHFVDSKLELGKRHFVILPLFFGSSGLLVDYIPRIFKKSSSDYSDACIEFAPTLVDVDKPDDGLAAIIVSLIRKKLDTIDESRISQILLIDHGSPLMRVTRCRDIVANQVGEVFKRKGMDVMACSMERRNGEEYSFSDPLLENLLNDDFVKRESEILLARLFLFPGRHASPGGDIDQIIENSEWSKNGGIVHQTELVGQHPDLVSLLEENYYADRISID